MSKRRTIQAIFVVLGLLWMAFVSIDLLGGIMGDCASDQWCEGRKSNHVQVVFWRGLCVTILLFIAYRKMRVEPDY